jgi:DNA-binding MarR family transcriptional regulator
VPDSTPDLVESGELTRMLIEVAERAKADFAAAAAPLGLPAPLARALLLLDRPMPMREVAARLRADPSIITGVADQLEERGLISRTPGRDRRVKLLQPTPEGEALRGRLATAMAQHAAVAHRLSPDQRASLRALLEELLRFQRDG